MPGNTIGKLFTVATWGESHGPAIGAVIDGCPSGIKLSKADLQKDLDRRKPKNNKISTSRKETDQVKILSGVFEGKTLGTPISVIVENKDQRSHDYSQIKNIFRPGHADLTYFLKYGHYDYRGGGRASGRETIGRVIGGAIAKKILNSLPFSKGRVGVGSIKIIAYTTQIGPIKSEKFDKNEINKNALLCPDKIKAKEMIKYIEKQKTKGDSVGGIIEIIVKNCPAGLGEPVFDKLSADLAKALMSIGSVKGIEFGSGFSSAEKLGSKNNDPILSLPLTVRTRLPLTVGTRRRLVPTFASNNSGLPAVVPPCGTKAGGILGGISTGQDLIINLAIKPTSSIALEQQTINHQGKPVKIKIQGRHDACIVPRLIPVAESMVAIVLADHILRQNENNQMRPLR